MISVTLPSRRPQALKRAINNLLLTSFEELEIIVVAPFSVDFERPTDFRCRFTSVWVPETLARGPNVAHERAFHFASGDYVLAWVDDHLLEPGWSEAVAELDGKGSPACVGLRHRDDPKTGTCFGMYYPYFPLMRRRDVAAIGGWLSGEYRSGFADVDLGMRVWKSAGICVPSQARVVVQHADDLQKELKLDGEAQCEPEDMQRFLDKWGPVFGQGWDTTTLRGFNRDVAAA